MNKTQFAFRCSAEKLFEQESPIYFWTFTMEKTLPDWNYSSVWSTLIRYLSNLYGGTLKGLKVLELHKDHGIHWHALLNKRIWVGQVRRIGRKIGVGRVDVDKVRNVQGTIKYLSEYLSKEFIDQNIMYSRCSRWGTVGGFQGVRVRDVEMDSEFHRRIRICQTVMGKKRLGYLFTKVVFVFEGSDKKLEQMAIRYMATGTISGLLDKEEGLD